MPQNINYLLFDTVGLLELFPPVQIIGYKIQSTKLVKFLTLWRKIKQKYLNLNFHKIFKQQQASGLSC